MIGSGEAPKHTACDIQAQSPFKHSTTAVTGTILFYRDASKNVGSGWATAQVSSVPSSGSLILPSRFAICRLHNKEPARAMGCNTMKRIPRTYISQLMTALFHKESVLTRIERGFWLVDQMEMLIHTEATHQTKSLRATMTIKPIKFADNRTANPIH